MMLVLLIITYFLVLGPTAIYLRLVNHRKLPKDDFEKDTTWVDVPEQTVPLQDHLKQF